jgi:4'-phosphopantetheinyl transferase
MLELSRGEIHLWFASDQIDDARAGTCRAVLSADERERERRFHFQEHRDRYLVTRALVRTVLSRYEPVDPAHWLFASNAYGRPEIDGRMRTGDLRFNVAHSAGIIVLVVAKGRALGVDVENTDARDGLLNVAKQFFSTAELAELIGAPANCQRDRFFQYWTLKESYIKARGMGLSIPLEKFSFALAQTGTIGFEITPDLADDPDRWQFWQIRLAAECLIAICAERVGRESPAITARRLTYLDIEEIVAVRLDRLSKPVS